MNEPEFKVEGAYISGDERDRILGSETISLEDARVILSSNHSFSLGDALQFINTKFPPPESRNLNTIYRGIYSELRFFCEIYGPKPDTVCFDPDDRRTWGPFKSEFFRFPEQDICYNISGRGLRGDPVFELYSITINKLDPKRDFSLIYMKSEATDRQPFIIYKRPKGKDVECNKPLPLRIPLLPPDPSASVIISFTNSNTLGERWLFSFPAVYYTGECDCKCKCKCYPIKIEECEDERGKSMASVSYRMVTEASWAKLTFRIFEKEDRDIYVTYGAITATDGEDCRTKRIIREYRKEEGPVCSTSDEDLEVYRSVFGVSKDGTYMRVEVDLTYFVKGFPDEEKKIQGSLDFTVPESYWVDLLTLRTPHADLVVQTVWKTPIS